MKRKDENTLELLTEARTRVGKHGVNILDKNQILSIMGDVKGQAFQTYLDVIMEGSDFSEDEQENFRQLSETSSDAFLSEASMNPEMSVFAPFQLILLKQIFSRRIARKLITSTSETGSLIKVGLFKTVLQDTEGNEFDLKDINDTTDIKEGWYESIVTLANGTYEAFADANLNTLDKTTGVKNRKLDKDLEIIAVVFDNTTTPKEEVSKRIQVGEDGAFVEKISWTSDDGATTKTDRLFGVVDFDTGELNFSSTKGTITEVTVKYRLSNSMMETNDLNLFLKYEADYRIDIGDGRLINVGIPLNYLEKIKAFQDMDGMQQAIDKVAFAHSILDDREVLKAVKGAVAGNPQSQVNWTKTFVAGNGISVSDYNREVLFKINQAIARTDDALQFTSVYEHNIPINPNDAAYVTSPTIIDNPQPVNHSVVSGSFNYNVLGINSAIGKVNLLSTSSISEGQAPIVPKTRDLEERIIHRYELSSFTSSNGSFRNRQASLIKNIASLERSKLVVHEPKAISAVNFNA